MCGRSAAFSTAFAAPLLQSLLYPQNGGMSRVGRDHLAAMILFFRQSICYVRRAVYRLFGGSPSVPAERALHGSRKACASCPRKRVLHAPVARFIFPAASRWRKREPRRAEPRRSEQKRKQKRSRTGGRLFLVLLLSGKEDIDLEMPSATRAGHGMTAVLARQAEHRPAFAATTENMGTAVFETVAQ